MVIPDKNTFSLTILNSLDPQTFQVGGHPENTSPSHSQAEQSHSQENRCHIQDTDNSKRPYDSQSQHKQSQSLNCHTRNEVTCDESDVYSRFRRLRRRHVKKIPNDDSIVVRTADDLKVVKLKPKNPACMLLHSQHQSNAMHI